MKVHKTVCKPYKVQAIPGKGFGMVWSSTSWYISILYNHNIYNWLWGILCSNCFCLPHICSLICLRKSEIRKENGSLNLLSNFQVNANVDQVASRPLKAGDRILAEPPLLVRSLRCSYLTQTLATHKIIFCVIMGSTFLITPQKRRR